MNPGTCTAPAPSGPQNTRRTPRPPRSAGDGKARIAANPLGRPAAASAAGRPEAGASTAAAAVLMGLPAGRRHLAPRRGLCLGTGGAGLPWASGPAKAAGGGGGPSPGLYCAGLAVQGRAAPLRVAVRLRPPLRGRLRRFSSPTDSAVVRPAHPVSARPCRAAEPRPAETGWITAGRLRRSSALSTMGAAPLLPPTPAGRLSRQCARSPLTTDTTLPWRTRAAQS